jgi:hypothetical protein
MTACGAFWMIAAVEPEVSVRGFYIKDISAF